MNSLLRGHILCNLDIWDQIKCSKSVHILEVLLYKNQIYSLLLYLLTLGSSNTEATICIFRRAVSHSFCPGAELVHTLIRVFILSVTSLAAAASKFFALGALGSAASALAASRSLVLNRLK